jgi:ferrous iron transport protein B
MSARIISVALVGNPNTGKSTLFNALSGLSQHVGNYPGVTVEMKKGRFNVGEQAFQILDLPGTYSLAPRSLDEAVAVDLLLGRRPEDAPPDVILSIVDASNLDRHLYLTTQVMELGKPVVVAVNMVDVAMQQGQTVNIEELSKRLGLLVLGIQANTGEGLEELRQVLLQTATNGTPPKPVELPAQLDEEAQRILTLAKAELPLFLARRLILDVDGSTETWFIGKYGDAAKTWISDARSRLKENGHTIPAFEARARYGFIRAITNSVVTKPAVRFRTMSDKLDAVLTHKLWGTLIFFVMLFLVFSSVFFIADPTKKLLDQGSKALSGQIETTMSAGPLRSLLIDGVIAGVGGVITFLPQILVLFFFIAVMEDCGYMARAAFLMDRIMSRCGLSGKSFIPLLSSLACAVPGILATRVIENRWDRLATILVAPLMSCSARLPVYSLMIAVLLPADSYGPLLQATAMFGLYMIGFIAAPLVALVLRKTLLKGGTSRLLMEMPSYKRPQLRTVFRRMFDAGWAFLKRASTIIFATMVLIWAALYFPATDTSGANYETSIAQLEEADSKPEARKLKAEWKKQSYLGRVGVAMQPVFDPVGWDWRIGMATLASFPAREVIVGTLSMLYEVDEEEDGGLEQSIQTNWSADEKTNKLRVPTALSVLVFFALCCQCASTLAVIKRETNSWRWPIFTFVYMTTLAYVSALVVFQVGRILVG